MLLLLLLIPLLGSLLAAFLPANRSRQIGLASSVANLLLTAAACWWFNAAGSAQYGIDVPWVASAGIRFSLGLDGISLLLVLLTNLLAPLIVLSSTKRPIDNEPRYYSLLLLMVMALNGVFMAQDGLLFYVFYELALIPIYFICAIWGGHQRIRITLKFFIYTFVGSLFMLLSLIYVYLQTNVGGLHSFAWADLVAVQLSPTAAIWVILGFFLAFAVKMPLFPFHTWQPDTYVTAPTGGTMLLAGIMLKMGIYGAIRWMIPLAPEALQQTIPVFMTLAVIGIIYASIIAVKQSDMKRLVAYSSIAHVGLIAAGVFSWNKLGLQGAMIQMFNHGINVVGLFFAVDLIERRVGTRSLSELGGIAKSAPRFAALFMIITLGSLAVPLTNGFVGEFLLLNGVWNYSNSMGAVAGLTIILGSVYLLRMYGLSLFGPVNRLTADFKDVDATELLVLGSLAAMVLLLGFFPQPLLSLTDASVDAILRAVQL